MFVDVVCAMEWICLINMASPAFRATKVARISDMGNLFCFFIFQCSFLCFLILPISSSLPPLYLLFTSSLPPFYLLFTSSLPPLVHNCFLSCQKATAAAAATLRESTWCDMGMRTT